MPKKLESNSNGKNKPRSGIQDTGTPARKVVTRSPHRSVGIMACSWVQDQSIEYESQLERRFLQRALLFPLIKTIIHQPFTVHYHDHENTVNYYDPEKLLKYTPDFLVTFKNGKRVVIEVKPQVFVKKHLTKLTRARAILAEGGLPFLVLTEKEIDFGLSSVNAALLLRYARGSIDQICHSRCIDFLTNVKAPVPMGVLMEQANVSLTEIFHLAARGHVHIPLETEIDVETLITTPIEREKNGLIRFCSWFNTSP